MKQFRLRNIVGHLATNEQCRFVKSIGSFEEWKFHNVNYMTLDRFYIEVPLVSIVFSHQT